jgi:opacity protein-like surface antigen
MLKRILMVAAILLPGAAYAQDTMINNWFVEAYGGVRLANNLDYDGSPYDMAQGQSFGIVVGVDTGMGVTIDLDLQHTDSYYLCCGAIDNLDSTSLMIDAQYEAWLTDNFGIYAGGGFGAIYLDYFQSYDTGLGWGYQAEIGAAAKISDNFTIFTEYKVQGALGGSISVSGTSSPYDIEYNTASVLAGVRFSMN